ncbi:MAG: methyltransferase domain-containing protein, partial [Thermoplasmata archaeon]|nr:methyltransferase domain-containing protein [Thermoplasmata archaeon]
MSPGEPTRSNWTRIDRTKDPQAFIRLLDATRRRWLHAARADPPGFFEYLHLTPGAHVLNVGCGPGDFDRVMAPLVLPGGRITAVDYSATMIREATERSRGSELPIEFRQADVHALPFPDASFDRTLATQVFQHLPDATT